MLQDGGFLELRFVRIKQGGGVLRDRYGLEGQDLRSKVNQRKGAGLVSKSRRSGLTGPGSFIPYTQVRDIRGGGIFFDAGSLGGNLFEVVFIADVRIGWMDGWMDGCKAKAFHYSNTACHANSNQCEKLTIPDPFRPDSTHRPAPSRRCRA